MSVEILREVRYRYESRRVDGKAGVLQTDEGYEDADADGHSAFQRERDRVEDGFPHVRKREQDEDHAFTEYGEEGDVP